MESFCIFEILIIVSFCRDIPGVNNLTAPRKFPQEVFASDNISHAGQVETEKQKIEYF